MGSPYKKDNTKVPPPFWGNPYFHLLKKILHCPLLVFKRTLSISSLQNCLTTPRRPWASTLFSANFFAGRGLIRRIVSCPYCKTEVSQLKLPEHLARPGGKQLGCRLGLARLGVLLRIFFWGGLPYQNRLRQQVGSLILTSLLEDLVVFEAADPIVFFAGEGKPRGKPKSGLGPNSRKEAVPKIEEFSEFVLHPTSICS